MSALAGVSVGQQRQAPPWRRQWQHFRYVTTANPVTLLAFIGLGVMIAVAILGPYLIPYDPLASLAEKALKPPSLSIGLVPTSWAVMCFRGWWWRPGLIC